MSSRVAIFLSSIALVFFSFHCMANIKHISLHEVESSVQQPLSIKLNIVAKDVKELKFILINQSIETELEYKRINDYMLRLTGHKHITGAAKVNVYELNNNLWQLIKTPVIPTVTQFTANDKSIVSKAQKPEMNFIKPEHPNKIATTAVQKLSSIETTDCLLTRKPKETLWSIASRYKDTWDLDIFSTMIVIYRSNLSKFNKKHIAKLIDAATLTCPNKEALVKVKLSKKKEMYIEFNRLKSLRPKKLF